MRIISGKFKNKKLFFPLNIKTRPLKESVRENIFNILEHSKFISTKIEGSLVLDLYAGTGSFGLECISRGAKKIYFVENDKEALLNLNQNILKLKINDQVKIHSMDILKFFKNLNINKKIDLVFLDPPYRNQEFIKFIEILKEKEILNKNHVLVLHREYKISKNSQELDAYKKNIIENRVYGRSEIFFLKFFWI